MDRVARFTNTRCIKLRTFILESFYVACFIIYSLTTSPYLWLPILFEHLECATLRFYFFLSFASTIYKIDFCYFFTFPH